MRSIMGWMATAGLLLAASSVAAEGFKIIVNERNPRPSLSRAEVSEMLLKKRTHWSDGSAVVPVDQQRGSPARGALSMQVHGRTADAVKSYWQQQIFSGRDVPPV